MSTTHAASCLRQRATARLRAASAHRRRLVRSKASLLYAQAGDVVTKGVRVALDLFNLLDARDSDIDYYYRSRLPGKPLTGVEDIHFHATLPRTARVNRSWRSEVRSMTLSAIVRRACDNMSHAATLRRR